MNKREIKIGAILIENGEYNLESKRIIATNDLELEHYKEEFITLFCDYLKNEVCNIDPDKIGALLDYAYYVKGVDYMEENDYANVIDINLNIMISIENEKENKSKYETNSLTIPFKIFDKYQSKDYLELSEDVINKAIEMIK